MNLPQIIFADQDLLVLDKPSGWIVNKSDTTLHQKTVQEWVEDQFSIASSHGAGNCQIPIDKESDFAARAGIVHRLDKETSGILLAAKTPQAFVNLQAQFKERIVKKTYLALAHGKVVPPESVINVPVGRLEFNRKRFGVVAGGREAVTKYKTISNFQFPIFNSKEQFSLLELYPETGRTHQIRVHLKYLNHPIFGDELYAGRKTARQDRKILARVFLHAARISFLHPTNGKTLTFESKLPPDLEAVLSQLKS